MQNENTQDRVCWLEQGMAYALHTSANQTTNNVRAEKNSKLPNHARERSIFHCIDQVQSASGLF